MSDKVPNTSIHCRVKSCEYHCGDKSYCSLDAIRVEPCESCHSGNPADESMCGSYSGK